MKVLILGGTGAMGIYLRDILIDMGHEVFVTSRQEHTDKERCHYLYGNARDTEFLKDVLLGDFDAIVDFMVYQTVEEFTARRDLLLKKTGHYLFLSSSRVYAESQEPIKEEITPRLLDICKDAEYLKTEEYALLKARQENVLCASQYKNWTIVRPYITYSAERLQLGVFEKEHWLYRALQGKSIVFSKDIAAHETSMTYGYDVAKVMTKMLGQEKAMEESVHIATGETMTWREIVELYQKVFEKIMGHKLDICWLDTSEKIGKYMCNEYQIKYDRLFERRFDSGKVEKLCGEQATYISMREGIKKCFIEFLEGERVFRDINWRWEGYADKICGERMRCGEMPSWKAGVKYVLYRYMVR